MAVEYPDERNPNPSRSFNQIIKDTAYQGFTFFTETTGGTLKYFGDQLAAIPGFFRTVNENPKALAVIKDTGRIAMDVGAIVAVQAANSFIQKSIEENTPEEGMLLPYTLMMGAAVLNIGTWIFKQRQRLQIAMRSFVLFTQQSGVFKEATEELDVRSEFENDVCEECSKMRYYKGEFKDFILFYAQQYLLEYGLSNVPYVGKPSALILENLLRGQLILSYRLANEGICERHRAIYFREYMELCLSMGLSVEGASYLLSQSVESLTGVPQDVYNSRIKELVSLYFIGLSHHMSLPPTITESTKKNPLALTHLFAGEALEVQMAGIKARAPVWMKMMESDEETIDFVALIHNAIRMYRDPKTEEVLIFFVPPMALGLKPFFNDAVVQHHWIPIRNTLVDTLDLIDAYVAKYIDKERRGLQGKVIDVLNRITIKGSNLTTKVVKYYFNISEELTLKLLDFFKSDDYQVWSKRFRQELILTGRENQVTFEDYDIEALREAMSQRQQKVKEESLRDALAVRSRQDAREEDNVTPSSIQAVKPERDVKTKTLIDTAPALIAHPKDSKDVVNQPPLSDRLQQVLSGTRLGLLKYKPKGVFGLGVKMDNIGEKRATVYRNLMNSLKDNPSQQLLICYAIFKNTGDDAGSGLWHTVRDHITKRTSAHNGMLFEVGSHLKEIEWEKDGSDMETLITRVNHLANHAHKETMYDETAKLARAIKKSIPSRDLKRVDESPTHLVTP